MKRHELTRLSSQGGNMFILINCPFQNSMLSVLNLCNNKRSEPRKKYLYAKFMWSAFSHIRAEFGYLESKSQNPVYIRVNTNQ